MTRFVYRSQKEKNDNNDNDDNNDINDINDINANIANSQPLLYSSLIIILQTRS